MSDKIKVRFNLGRGENYMKWQIIYDTGKIDYQDPESIQLVLSKCGLKNRKRIANKIYSGGDKVVCAWVSCESIRVRKLKRKAGIDFTNKVQYNPRLTPNWVLNDRNVDGEVYDEIVSFGKDLFLTL